MNTAHLNTNRFDDIALRTLKEKASMSEHLTWDMISAKVVELVGNWEQRYDSLRQVEVSMKYVFPDLFEKHHLDSIQTLIDAGTTLLMIIDKVETDSNPPLDMTESHNLLIKGLCALMISRRAFSPDAESELLSSTGENVCSNA